MNLARFAALLLEILPNKYLPGPASFAAHVRLLK